MSRTVMLWMLWIAITVPVGLYVLAVIVYGGNRSFLLIGKTTSGHHQIELACDTCHTSVFGGPDVLQDACVKCHGPERGRPTTPIRNRSSPIRATPIASPS